MTDMTREAVAPNLENELRKMIRAYVNLLEVGRDRIISLGGDCDRVDIMEAGDPALRSARAALAALRPAQDAEGWVLVPREPTEAMINAGLLHYSEGGCSGLDACERREVVGAIVEAALAASPPRTLEGK